MRIDQLTSEAIKLSPRSPKAQAWIDKVYAEFPQTWQNNHVMLLGGTGDDQQFAMFELVPSLSKRDAVEVKWFQAYPLRQGVGSRAMQRLQDMASEDGIALTLYPWNKGQVSQGNLVKFYRSAGFKPSATGAKTMVWEPALDEAKWRSYVEPDPDADPVYKGRKPQQTTKPKLRARHQDVWAEDPVYGRFLLSGHWQDRLEDRGISIEQGVDLIQKAFDRNKSDVLDMPLHERFLIRDSKQQSMVFVKDDRFGGAPFYVAVTYLPKGSEPPGHMDIRHVLFTGDLPSKIKEGLTHTDPVERWIAVFKASKHPKFADKTPEQREKMARAAQYRAVQNQKPFAAKPRIKSPVPSLSEAAKTGDAQLDALLAANPQIKDANATIAPGQQIRLPNGSSYTIARNDNLWNISRGKTRGTVQAPAATAPTSKPSTPAAQPTAVAGTDSDSQLAQIQRDIAAAMAAADENSRLTAAARKQAADALSNTMAKVDRNPMLKARLAGAIAAKNAVPVDPRAGSYPERSTDQSSLSSEIADINQREYEKQMKPWYDLEDRARAAAARPPGPRDRGGPAGGEPPEDYTGQDMGDNSPGGITIMPKGGEPISYEPKKVPPQPEPSTMDIINDYMDAAARFITDPAYSRRVLGLDQIKENMDHHKDSQAVPELKAALLARKKLIKSKAGDKDAVYDIINGLMTSIAKAHGISGQKLHDMWVDQYGEIPDTWILHESVLPGSHTPTEAVLAKQYTVGVAEIKRQLKKGIKIELEHTNDRAVAREIALDHLGENLYYYDRLKQAGLEEAAGMTTAALRDRLNELMAQDQAYADPTQRAPWQEGVWRFINANKAQIFSDLGDQGNGDWPAAPFAAWLLVQHMDAHPERQAAFYKMLRRAIPNHPKLQFLRDRAAVNQWMLQHYQEPEYHVDGKPLANPTSDVRDPRLFKDAGIKAQSRQEALDNAEAAGNKLLVAAVKATGAKTQPSYTQKTTESLDEAWLDMNEYGGWITPNRKVEYVEDQGHEAHLRREHGLRIAEAFLAGYVRFQTNARTGTFSVEGMLPALRKTYRIWGQTALNARNVYVDIFQWRDDMTAQGLTPHMMFRPGEGDKPQIIHSFGTKGTEPVAEAKHDFTNDEVYSLVKDHFDKKKLSWLSMALGYFNPRLDKWPELHKLIDDHAQELITWYDKLKKTSVQYGGSPLDSALNEIATLTVKGYRAPWIIKYLNDNKQGVMVSLLSNAKAGDKSSMEFLNRVMPKLKKLNLGWPELDIIERSMRADKKITEGKKRKAKTIIDGMIKTLIKQGRTRDEAIADLKKQVDSRFYEQIDAAAAMITEDDHSEKMDHLVAQVYDTFREGFPFDALDAMESARATVNDDPRLKALFDRHRTDLADMFLDELRLDSDYGALAQMADMIESVGIPMPDPRIRDILESKSSVINKLVSRNLNYAGISEVVLMLEALEHWGLHYYLEDFVDLEDGKEDVIRSLLKLYKAGRTKEVADIIKRLREEDVDWPELVAIEKSLGAGKITETREAALKWLKSYLPAWPDYVVRDWLYQSFKGDFGQGDDSPKSVVDKVLGGEGMDAHTRWQFVPNFQFSMDRLTPWTVDKLQARWGGKQHPDMPGIPRDAERHDTQAVLAAQQGGVRDEPVILKKVGDQYELIEGWHRTIQHFKQFPNGYKGPAWIALDAKPVSENFADGQAPTGVIFNGNVAYVGQTHGKPIKLSDDLKKRIQDMAAKHGAWYEGNGADRAHTKDLISSWQGSWDDEAAASITGYPPQFLYVLFANVDANNTIKRVGTDLNDTIFNRIIKNQNSGKFFPDRSYDAATLKKFLSMVSQEGYDLHKMAQQPATAENVKKFFKTGEKLMWPSNWEEYPNPAGEVAKKANDHRDNWLVNRKSGVYVMGAGHLLSIAKIGGFKLIGGERINDSVNENISETKQRLDRKCWTGYRKQGTKIKNGVRVNNCVPAESIDENSADGKDPGKISFKIKKQRSKFSTTMLVDANPVNPVPESVDSSADMLSMDPWTFDQSQSGWRSLPAGQQTNMLKRYIARYVTSQKTWAPDTPKGDKPLDPYLLVWHLGQALALNGDTKGAITWMQQSTTGEKHWDDYVAATIAFLLRDRKWFFAHSADASNYNADTMARLRRGWGKSYRDVYENFAVCTIQSLDEGKDLEEALLRNDYYGGWIEDDGHIGYVDFGNGRSKWDGHEGYLLKQDYSANKDSDEVMQEGWVRFITDLHGSRQSLSLEGTLAGLRNHYRKYAQTVLSLSPGSAVYISVIGDKDYAFRIPEQKREFMKLLGPQSHVTAQGDVSENFADGKAPGTTLDEIIKMPPNTTATSSGLVRWSYDDSMEKGAKPTKVDLVKGKQSLMFDLGDHLRIFVMLGDKPIFYLSLGRYADGYKVGVVNTEPEARGQGIGINIYAALADHLNKPIYSDRTQSDASRLGIWQKLIDRFPGRVVGYDPKTKEDLPLAQGPAGPAVRGKEPIYAPKKGPADRGNTEATLSRTRLLKLLPAGDGTALGENFEDGKGPGRQGDSQRHGIPKGATIAQLEKAAEAPGRKGQLARWQINMRRGRAKAHESEEMTADQWQALRKEDPRSYLGIKDYRNRKWWESHFKAAMARARVKGESHFEFPPGTNMWYMVTKNPLEEGGGPPHGTPENELAMMKARTKPAVTFLDMGQYEEMYEPNMEHYDWIKQKWRLPNMDVNYYVIGQPGQEARVKRIGQLIYDMNKNGQNPTADYHRELGRLLGYSEADINSFLKDLAQED